MSDRQSGELGKKMKEEEWNEGHFITVVTILHRRDEKLRRKLHNSLQDKCCILNRFVAEIWTSVRLHRRNVC